MLSVGYNSFFPCSEWGQSTAKGTGPCRLTGPVSLDQRRQSPGVRHAPPHTHTLAPPESISVPRMEACGGSNCCLHGHAGLLHRHGLHQGACRVGDLQGWFLWEPQDQEPGLPPTGHHGGGEKAGPHIRCSAVAPAGSQR
jgi:hypothetical protein